MGWWKSGGGGYSSGDRSHSAQSPSSESSSPNWSSSSSSPPRRHRRDFGIMWSRGDVHHQQPRLTRQRKLRHLTTLDVEGLGVEGVAGGGGWGPFTPVTRLASSLETSPAMRFSAAAGSGLRPQPLPRPETQGYQLPLPREALGRWVGDELSATSESSCSQVEPVEKILMASC